MTSKENDITSKLKNCLNTVAHSLEICSSPSALAQHQVQSGFIFTDHNGGENGRITKRERRKIIFFLQSA
jgi:hypothetical protein